MADIIKDLTEVSNFLCGENVRDQRLSSIVEDALELLQQFRWIPVSERLPKSIANKVLVWLEHDDVVGYIGYGHYEKYKGVETWYDLEHEEPFSTNGYRVTHWMPLPQPPEGGKQE